MSGDPARSFEPTLDGLCTMLIARGLLTPEGLSRGLDMAHDSHVRLPAVLTRLGLVSERELAEAAADLLQVPRLERHRLQAVSPLPDDINRSFLKLRRVLPLTDVNGAIQLAMADPLDHEARAAMEFALGRPVAPLVAEESDIEDFLDQTAPTPSSVSAAATPLLVGRSTSVPASDLALLNDRNSDAPIIRLVNRVIAKAVTLGASDIHIEPQSDALRLRFRVDGTLSEHETMSSRFAEPVASRVKLMAGLDIAERRLPQDGRIQTSVRGQSIDLRVATFPSIHGETLVLRLLGQRHVELDLDRIGLPAQGLLSLRASLREPSGLVLITGPTGSGKTTTLYAALNVLRRPGIKILSVEDPIEYALPGITQLQVQPEIDLTFASALRAALRNDPDVIMVGEIRDRETADVAVRAALTGHLVLATLHTNSAAGAITRLLDLGIEDYLLASVILLASAQRLVRRLCTHCSTWAVPDDHARNILSQICTEAEGQSHRELKVAKGCPTCQGRGFAGRIPVFEAIGISDELRARITRPFDETGFDAACRVLGIHSIAQCAIQMAHEGLTTMDEVVAVVGN